MGRLRTLVLLAVSVGLLVPVAAPALGQQSSAHGVEIQTPDPLTVGENEIRVVVDNSNAGEDLFSPIVEVPLGNALSAPAPDPHVELDGTVEDRTYAVQASSYRPGESLFVYGQNVPAGETRTYVFTIEVDEAGNRTIESDVRPLYNEPNNARASVAVEALTTGTLDVAVRNGTAGSPVDDATVTIDGTDRTGGDVAVDLVEGEYDVTAAGAGTDFPTLTSSVSAFATRSVTFTHYASLPGPRVVANATAAEVVAGSEQETVVDAGSATSERRHEVSFLLDVDDGTAVVGVQVPAAVSPAKDRGVSVGSGTLVGTERVGNATWVTVEAGAVTSVSVEYTGYRSGDATGDDAVDSADAAAAARAAADPDASGGYGDVDGDGQVTAVDAMFIQQYADGNRTADYGPAGGGS